MATTVAEIGRLAGCSSATVSRAMNNSRLVSPETRAVVLKVLRETQYVARRNAGRPRKYSEKASARGLVEVILHRHSPIERISLGSDGLKVAPLSRFPASPEAFSKPYQLSNSFYRQIVDGAVEELARRGRRAGLPVRLELPDADARTKESWLKKLGELGCVATML